MNNSYQFTSKEGDIVFLPGGLKGEVRKIEFHIGGNSKEVCVKPFAGWFTRLRLFLSGKTRFYDHDINKLVLLKKSEGKEVGV